MELGDALRTTGAVREFTDEPVPDTLVYDVLDTARFAPSGGNRQPWRVVLVHDPEQRRAIADAYLDAWHEYVGHLRAGLVPFSPLATPGEQTSAQGEIPAAIAASPRDGFAENLSRVPVMLVVVVDVAALAATDRDLGRYQFVGGASVYPFAWNILLVARSRGLGGVMTTVATRNEPRLRTALKLSESQAVAAVMALGRPRRQVTSLTRRTVEQFCTVDTVEGSIFNPYSTSPNTSSLS